VCIDVGVIVIVVVLSTKEGYEASIMERNSSKNYRKGRLYTRLTVSFSEEGEVGDTENFDLPTLPRPSLSSPLLDRDLSSIC